MSADRRNAAALRRYPRNSAEAPARIVAPALIANGRVTAAGDKLRLR